MKILFQGDSITDAKRTDIGDGVTAGTGYPMLVKAQLEFSEPSITVENRGISGNRITDLYARWKIDCTNLAPDILTILIGVNDVWHEINYKNGVDAGQFETVYRLLLDNTVKALPNIKIILMGAYLLHGTATDESSCGFGYFSDEVAKRAAIAKKLAEEYCIPYIDLQSEFDRHITKDMPATHWSVDGVHPTAAGHELIKRAWLRCYEKI